MLFSNNLYALVRIEIGNSASGSEKAATMSSGRGSKKALQ